MKPFYQVMQNEKSADVYIFGNIIGRALEEFGEQSAVTLTDKIKNLDVDEINVHIDSYGGEVKEAWGMFNALRQHKAKINTYADGFVASAAIFPFLAGDNRYANSVSAFFMHKCIGGASGYADDLRKAADDIDFMTETGANAFVDVCGMDKDKVLDLMGAETWLNAEQALEFGIATEIVKENDSSVYSQDAKANIMQKIFTNPIEEKAEVKMEENVEEETTEKKSKLINLFERI